MDDKCEATGKVIFLSWQDARNRMMELKGYSKIRRCNRKIKHRK